MHMGATGSLWRHQLQFKPKPVRYHVEWATEPRPILCNKPRDPAVSGLNLNPKGAMAVMGKARLH